MSIVEAGEISRLWSPPGISQSAWNATPDYQAFQCPAGTLRGEGVDMNFTADRSDDRYFVTCETRDPAPTPSPTPTPSPSPSPSSSSSTSSSETSTSSSNSSSPTTSSSSNSSVNNSPTPTPTSTPSASNSSSNNDTRTSSASSTTSSSARTPIGNGAPFTVVLPGQLSTSQCPSGYQGANGIIVDIGNGTFTECWPAKAWNAWRIGGNTWEQFKSSGGSYDPSAAIANEENYRLAVRAAQAAAEEESKAWNAANPGKQKCVQWGPITNPNGGTSSGGVCANPVGTSAVTSNTETSTSTSTTNNSQSGTTANDSRTAQTVTQTSNQRVLISETPAILVATANTPCPNGGFPDYSSGAYGRVYSCSPYPAGSITGISINVQTGQVTYSLYGNATPSNTSSNRNDSSTVSTNSNTTSNNSSATSSSTGDSLRFVGDVSCPNSSTGFTRGIEINVTTKQIYTTCSPLKISQQLSETSTVSQLPKQTTLVVDSGTVTKAVTLFGVQVTATDNSVKATGSINSVTAAVQAIVVDSSEAKAITTVFDKLSSVKSQTTLKTISLPKAPDLVDISYSTESSKVCLIKGNKISKKSNGQCEVKVVAEDSDGNTFESSKVIVFKR